MNSKIKFEIRQLDAWMYDGDWSINDSWHICDFETQAINEKRAFVRVLNSKGISFKLNRTLIDFDGDCYTIIDRKSKEPLFIAIPEY